MEDAARASLAGRVVALIDDDHFTTSYIQRALVRAGAQLIGPAASVQEAIAALEQAGLSPDVACVGADFCKHSGLMLARLAERRIPCLFIGGSPACADFPAPNCWLSRPFAGFQIVDALTDLLNIHQDESAIVAA